MKHKLISGSRLVVASHNKGKVWEINQLLAPYGLLAIAASALDLAEPEETEATFEGNALIKARAAAEGSGLPALADDSGLEIDALDGAPGVYSANWAGDGKDFAVAMQRVRDELERAGEWKKKPKPTKANFISVLCLCWPDGKHKVFEGKVKGHVIWPPRGGNGFGYDPMFVPKGETLTFGEMEPKAKYAMSHRTRAFEKFKDKFLADLDVVAPSDGPNAERDASGLAAAAANISTQEELATFVINLRAEIEKKSNGSGAVALPEYLSGLNVSLAAAGSGDAPAWRTVAKALLAASGIK